MCSQQYPRSLGVSGLGPFGHMGNDNGVILGFRPQQRTHVFLGTRFSEFGSKTSVCVSCIGFIVPSHLCLPCHRRPETGRPWYKGRGRSHGAALRIPLSPTEGDEAFAPKRYGIANNCEASYAYLRRRFVRCTNMVARLPASTPSRTNSIKKGMRGKSPGPHFLLGIGEQAVDFKHLKQYLAVLKPVSVNSAAPVVEYVLLQANSADWGEKKSSYQCCFGAWCHACSDVFKCLRQGRGPPGSHKKQT